MCTGNRIIYLQVGWSVTPGGTLRCILKSLVSIVTSTAPSGTPLHSVMCSRARKKEMRHLLPRGCYSCG